jgi:site-specific recombinase XerC
LIRKKSASRPGTKPLARQGRLPHLGLGRLFGVGLKPTFRVSDVFSAGQVKARTSITQSKTRHPVRFEITEGTRRSMAAWLDDPAKIGSEHLWPGRFHERLHISTRQYARLVRAWVSSIGLEPSSYGTHSMRRTKVAQIYRKTANLRAVQLLLGHTKLDSTVRYLGVELEDALAISEAVEI